MGPIVASSFAITSAGQKSTSSSTTVQQLAPWTQSTYSAPTNSAQKTQMQTSWRFSYIPTMTTTTTRSSHISHSSLENHKQSSAEEISIYSQVTSTSLPATSDSQYTTQPSHNLPEIVSQPPSSISASSTSSRSVKAGIVIVPVDPHAVTVTVTTTTTEKEFGATTALEN
ncbi:hypothetical protein NU219Hw_g5416t1 [Hortaea werneckii]